MPHIQIDYSANIDAHTDMGAFCEALRAEAAGIDAFPLAGLRVRATRVDHYAIADGNPAHGFIDISVRLRAGRPDAVKQDAVARLFRAAEVFIAPAMATHPIALSMEMRDIDPALAPKTGSIRDHLEG